MANYTDEELKLFIDIFKTSETVYSLQWFSKEKNRVEYHRKSKNINFAEDAKKHLDGEITLGCYVIHLDGDKRDTCSWCVLDYDIKKETRKKIEALETEEAKTEAYDRELQDMKKSIRQLILRLPTVGIGVDQVLVEFSGSKGFHIWFFFEENISARMAFFFLNAIKSYFDLPKDLEVYPKQITAGDAYGNLIKLPLGIHRATGNRCKFIDILNVNKSDLGSQFQKLKDVKRITIDQVDAVITLASETNDMYTTTQYETDRELVDISKSPYNADINQLEKKCSAIKNLINKAKKHGHLIHSERLALQSFYIQFGEQGIKKIHEIISNCSDYDYEKTDYMVKQAIAKAYKPYTCAKLQELHICKNNCRNIVIVGGTSPIKFSYKAIKTDLSFTYIEEMETVECVNKTVKFPFKVTSMIQSGAAYAVAKKVSIKCPKTCSERYSQKNPCEYGQELGRHNDKVEKINIPPDDDYILSAVGKNVKKMNMDLAYRSSIPCPKPKKLKIKTWEHHHVSQILISSSDQIMRERLFETKTSLECKNYVAYYVGPGGIQTGSEYMGFGKILQHPDTHKLTFIITKIEPLMGNLNDFVPNEEEKTVLARIKNTPPSLRLQTIAKNIIQVKGRDLEVLCALLTFFSPLQIRFNGRLLNRGWLETCFIGDSSQGKSMIPTRLMEIAGFNNTIAGSQATEAGIIGGVATVEKKQYISWGMLPRCDRTLVFIDEIEKLQAKTNAITALREVRSTGLATITKIIHGTRLSRVRLIASANTKKDTSITDYKRGCQSIMGIMEGPDVRRFDIICFFYPNRVSSKEVMTMNELKQVCEFTPEDFKLALRFIWTRTADDINISKDTTLKILEMSYLLYEKYKGAAQTVPIIALDVYEKIARIASAFACWRMNTTDFKTIEVTPEDAENAKELLDTIYSSDDVGLDAEAIECLLRHEVTPEWVKHFKSKLKTASFARKINMEAALIHLNSMDKTRGDDLAFFLKTERSIAINLLQFLTVERLVESDVAGYYKPTTKMYKLVRAIGKGEIKLGKTTSEKERNQQELELNI